MFGQSVKQEDAESVTSQTRVTDDFPGHVGIYDLTFPHEYPLDETQPRVHDSHSLPLPVTQLEI